MATPIPPNDARFSPAEIEAATGGRWLGSPPAGAVVGVCTDSRAVRPGELFVALAGEEHDGHRHVADAVARGASMVMVERSPEAPPGAAVLQVRSTIEALGALGRVALRRWRQAGADRRVVAVTGSAGKTTTRTVSCALLGQLAPGAVLGTRGNLNNRIGVPMMAFALAPSHRIAVLELGTSLPGEIAALGQVVEPDVALITLVAGAHTAGLGSIDGVAAEKGALYQSLQTDGIAIGNGDDPRVVAALATAPTARRVRYGFAAGLDYRIVDRTVHASGAARIIVRRPAAADLRVELPLLGDAGALALAAALAVTESITGGAVSNEQAAAAMDELGREAEQGRLRLRSRPDGLLLVDDSYNANPASCRSSLRAAAELAAVRGRPFVAILGEMRELGDAGPREHEALGQAVAEHPPRLLIAVEGLAELVAREAAALGVVTHFAPDALHAAREAVAAVRPEDVVLVKGSRGVRTERVVEALLGAGSHDVHPKGAA